MADETDDDAFKRYQSMCRDLNLDTSSANEGWQSYENVREHINLEGEQTHWYACAIYAACRKINVQAVQQDDRVVEGNGVNLTRLLRIARLSLVEFFNKSKQWANFTSLPLSFLAEINRLERNFEVTTNIFLKYSPIFFDLFVGFEETPIERSVPRSRKIKNTPCTSKQLFEFCWTLYIYVRSANADVSADLVTSYHFLLACCDFIFANAYQSNRKDLINVNFPGLPDDWKCDTPPCIISLLCDRHEGVVNDAKNVKQYHWRPQIRQLVHAGVLQHDHADELFGFLGVNFEVNFRAIKREYETYVLNKGDFDERTFLDERKRRRGRKALIERNQARVEDGHAISKKWQERTKNADVDENHQHLVPATPLTGRRYLSDACARHTSPLQTATQSVTHIHALLAGRTTAPSARLLQIFESCSRNPRERIERNVNEWGKVFRAKFTHSSENELNSHSIAYNRLELAIKLYFKLLESSLLDEYEKRKNRQLNDSETGEIKVDLSHILEQDIFHLCLFSCSLEIILYAFNSQRAVFPWILDAMKVDACYFYRVIEPIISIKDFLPRDIVKHLNLIEEQIMERIVWKSDSILWKCIAESNLPVPTAADVTAKRSLLFPIAAESNSTASHIIGSPRASSVSENFKSPILTGLKRVNVTSPAVTSSRKIGLITLEEKQKLRGECNEENEERPKRSGSLALFFRKFYHLSSVRIHKLLESLNLSDSELIGKIWTIFEYTVINHTEMLRNRHLDQILMCAIYVVCKLNSMARTFTEIMRCYRSQPQATSDVYRSVLLDADGTVHKRGDLIMFYNTIFVKKTQGFALKYVANKTDSPSLMISPVPRIAAALTSPSRRVCDRVFVKPHMTQSQPRISSDISKPLFQAPKSTAEPLTYCFSRSPAKDLVEINNMINNHDRRIGKRLLTEQTFAQTDEDAKRPCRIQQKLQGIIGDRKSFH